MFLPNCWACSEAIMLCNMAMPTWPVIFVNEAWEKATGIKSEPQAPTTFWGNFQAGPPQCIQWL